MNTTKNYFYLLLIGFLFQSIVFSQKEADKWYLPGPATINVNAPAIDFSSGSPVSLKNNGMKLSWEGTSTISDANGSLLFYTDGTNKLYNKNHKVTPNGDSIYMHNSVTQNSIFVPKPGNPNVYYLFQIGLPTASGSPTFFNLYYSEIDKTLNGGLGDVVSTKKNIVIDSSFMNCSEKMAVTKHCNGTDYWLLVHDYSGNKYKAYLISSTGISATPVVSSVGSNYIINSTTFASDVIGQMKFSPNGTIVAAMLGEQNLIEVFNFNKSTGVLSNVISLQNPSIHNGYGLEFSPDNSKIYSTKILANTSADSTYITQWDLNAGNNAAVIASRNIIAKNVSVFALQLAPDGKIYGANMDDTISVINNPNIYGAGCNFIYKGFSIWPQQSALGLPNFISSYFDKPNLFSYTTSNIVNSTTCLGNGSITINLSNVFGLPPYTYNWSNNNVDGPTNNLTSSISNLQTGNYFVVITDATCMSDTVYFTVGGIGPYSINQNVVRCTGTSYTLPGGTVVNTSGVYKDTLVANNGCDSIITTNLTFAAALYTTINATICKGDIYYLTSGVGVSVSGTYVDTLISVGGCDSIVTTNLTVIKITNSIIQNGNTLTCTTPNATYQWMDCSSGQIMVGDTNMSFTPANNGSYAVIVDSAGCKDTSACVNITIIGLAENESLNEIKVYPNPSNGEFILEGLSRNNSIEIFDIAGRIIYSTISINDKMQINLSDKENGIYFYKVMDTNKKIKTGKIIIQK